MDDYFNPHSRRENNNEDENERKIGKIFEDRDFEDFSSFKPSDRNFGTDYEPFDFHFDNNYQSHQNSLQNDEPKTEFKSFEEIQKELIDSGEYTLPQESESENELSGKPKMKKKMSKGKIIFISLAAIFIVLAVSVTGYAYNILGNVNYLPDSHKENEYISSKELMKSDSVYNILLLGTDERESQANYRSDTMMLVSIDKKNKTLKLTSFLRDSWLYIPGKDVSAKLNAACVYGGAQMVIDTIEYHYRVKIDKYVMINFSVFKKVVDGLGGVTLDISEAEAATIAKEGSFKVKPGVQEANGKLALWYARIRHLDSDFKRTSRQRKVIQAIVDKAKKTSPTVLLDTLNSVLPEIQTDLSKSDMTSLAFNAFLKYMRYDIEEMEVPSSGTWSNAKISGQAVLKVDIEKNRELLKAFIYGA